MKKKTGIIASLIMLFLLIYSCEQDDQIETFTSTDSLTESNKLSNDPINILADRENDDDMDCDETIASDLFAGQHILIGKLFIQKEGDYLEVTYDLSSSDWYLKETHLFVGDIQEAPFGNNGNPKIGHFPYHGDHGLVKEYSFNIPYEDINECYSVISHASVVLMTDGEESASETAFGFGDAEFSGNRWGWYQDICKPDCGEVQESNNDESNNYNDDNDTVNNDANADVSNPDNSEETNGCMDAYAYSSESNSTCFLNDFAYWGWSNKVIANDRHYAPGGVNYSYPLHASAYDCAVDNSILIGEVNMNVYGGDGILYANISVNLSKDELSITDLHIVANETVYPVDNLGNPSIDFEFFDVNLNSMNEKSYSVNWLDWFEQTNFIVHVKVCPEEIL